jgi:hypothetical protein
MSALDFPPALKFNRLQFGANVLAHLRQREDLNLGNIGSRVAPLLSAYRTVKPEFLDQFYEQLTGLVTHLEKYSALAESCSKSGAYIDRRQEQLNNVLSIVVDLERQPDVLRALEAMRRQ